MTLLSDDYVLDTIAAAIRSVLHDPGLELGPGTRFDDLAALDSMSQIAMVAETECRLGVTLEVDEIEPLQCVADLVRIVTAKRAG